MTVSPSHSARPDAILLCGPWPHPRIAVFTLLCELMTVLNRLGRTVYYVCDGYGLREHLGRDAVCLVEVPPDRPFDWTSAFAQKRVYPSLAALVDDDRRRGPGLLERVGVIHGNQDQLIFESDHVGNSTQYERTLADAVAARAGRRPRVIRTRYDDLQGNLDGFMRLTGIDYVALDRAGREKVLGGETDLRPVVAEHVRRHRELMRSWRWGEAFIDEAIHHAWWRLHQLGRWRYEVTHFDAVVCLTPLEVDSNRELLLCERADNLTHIPCGSSFAPNDKARADQLLYDYHHRQGLRCFRGGGAERESIAFAPEDKKVVFVGRATAIKGIYELAESLRNLYHSGRRSVRGILVGPFWPELRRELAAVDPTHAHEYMLFTGPVEDLDVLAALWAFGDVSAIPSHYEPFGLVGLESYRMGTPCVVTEGTGAGEAYLANPRRHGIDIALSVRRRHRDGIMRYYGVDVESLTEQLTFLIDHPPVARRLAEDGERFVREHYSAERMAAQYSALYDLLLDGEPACRLHG
jgi:glycosyltransferase involved in cell wall biosynthesis